VSLTLRPVVQDYELAVRGALVPTEVDALDGFEIVGMDQECTYLSGRVEGQGHLYDVLAALGAREIELVSLRPMFAELS
jgi:hypothetical protein